MRTPLELRYGSAMRHVPAPHAVRAGDYVHTSTMYPIDGDGRVVCTDDSIGEVGDSPVAVQTRQCLANLEHALREHGSSLDRVLKAEVHLADASDFHEFKLEWRNRFPKDPPARTTVVVGDSFPFRRARLSLDAVALTGDTALRRELLSDPDGPDPTEAEWASWAVRAGNLVFCSGFPAIDFRNGLAAGRKPGFPNYGNDAVAQAEYFFDALNRVLSQAGTSLEYALESILYQPDLSNFYNVDTLWPRYMPVPPGRAALGVKALTVPGAALAVSLTVLVPDKDHVKEESRAGILFHPTARMKVNYSPTLKAGPWLYIAGKTAGNMQPAGTPPPDGMPPNYSPPGLPHHFSDVEVQTRHILAAFTRQIEANGSDWQHCHHVRAWLINPRRDYRGFVRVWREHFPDPARAPALAFVPANEILYPGPLVEIDPTCVLKA